MSRGVAGECPSPADVCVAKSDTGSQNRRLTKIYKLLSFRLKRRPVGGSNRTRDFEHGHTEQNRDMPLRTASGSMRRRACSCVGLSLSGLPEAQRQRFCRPGALAGGAGHGSWRGKDMGAHRGQRPSVDLPLLSALRIDHSLRDRRMARRGRHTTRRLCRPDISLAKIFSLRTSQACLDRGARR